MVFRAKLVGRGVAALLGLMAGVGRASAQDALVTFYSHGSQLTSGLPGTHHDIYFGNIFDGPQGLFAFHDSFFLHNNRFLTLRLPAGPHTFGASNAKRPEPRETLVVDLKAGQHYFVRAQGESAGIPAVFVIQHGLLDLMACKDAEADLAKAKPLKDKALWKYARAQRATLVVDEAGPPSCPAP